MDLDVLEKRSEQCVFVKKKIYKPLPNNRHTYRIADVCKICGAEKEMER
jgi:ribosomal protein S14